MPSKEELLDRQKKLERVLPASVKGHFVEGSILEGVLARGDRKLSKVILKAWEKGCRFDQWKEHSRYDFWQQAFAETGINMDFYIRRERAAEEVLPWDHLQFAAEKCILWKEYQKISDPYMPKDAPVAKESIPIKPLIPTREKDVPPVQRLRIRLGRKGGVRFLSHLEQIDVFRRAARRANLPVAFSSGFSPQVKAAFGPAISVGYESTSEYFELDLIKRVEIPEATQKLKNALPEGFDVLEIKKIPLFFPSLDSLLNIARYRIDASASEERIKAFLSAEEIIVEKVKERQTIKINAKPLIKTLKCDNGMLYMELRFGPGKNVKPEKVAQLLLGLSEEETKTLRIWREGFLIEKKDGTILEA
jgi:radical SAM-linked protein